MHLLLHIGRTPAGSLPERVILIGLSYVPSESENLMKNWAAHNLRYDTRPVTSWEGWHWGLGSSNIGVWVIDEVFFHDGAPCLVVLDSCKPDEEWPISYIGVTLVKNSLQPQMILSTPPPGSCLFFQRKIWVFPKIGGKPTKMDGLFHGKPWANGWFGGKNHYFWFNTHMALLKEIHITPVATDRWGFLDRLCRTWPHGWRSRWMGSSLDGWDGELL